MNVVYFIGNIVGMFLLLRQQGNTL